MTKYAAVDLRESLEMKYCIIIVSLDFWDLKSVV